MIIAPKLRLKAQTPEYGHISIGKKAFIDLKREAKNHTTAAIAEYQKKIYGYDLISAKDNLKGLKDGTNDAIDSGQIRENRAKT